MPQSNVPHPSYGGGLRATYGGIPLWMILLAIGVVTGVGYHFYAAKKKNQQATNNPQFNFPQTLDQTSQTGSIDAQVGNLPPQDYWPYNQLVPMTSLALPGVTQPITTVTPTQVQGGASITSLF